MSVSERQLEVLRILARKTEPCEWGEVWDSYAWADPSSSLAMTNFDRVTDALLRRKLVTQDVENCALVSITESGRLLAEAAKRAAVKALHCIQCYDVVRSAPKHTPCRCQCHR